MRHDRSFKPRTTNGRCAGLARPDCAPLASETGAPLFLAALAGWCDNFFLALCRHFAQPGHCTTTQPTLDQGVGRRSIAEAHGSVGRIMSLRSF